MSTKDKEMAEVYRQRGEAWLLAMAFAKVAGYAVGVREPGEWPVHVIVLPGGKEVALHISSADAEPNVLNHETSRVWDGHTDAEREDRIRDFVRSVFAPERVGQE